MKDENLPLYKVAHHLEYCARMISHMADVLRQMIADAGGDADAEEVAASLSESSDHADECSNNILDSLK